MADNQFLQSADEEPEEEIEFTAEETVSVPDEKIDLSDVPEEATSIDVEGSDLPEEIPLEKDPDLDEEQEITEGDTVDQADSELVQVEFIDDGDDFEMDAALAGLAGESPYPNVIQREAWRPEFTIEDLVELEPGGFMYARRNRELHEQIMADVYEKHYQDELARIARMRQEYELKGRSIGGIFRRVFNAITGRHYGPGDHPSGSPQSVHGGDGGGADLAERPKHVGASIRLAKLANPRLTFEVNNADKDEWNGIYDEMRNMEWGRDPVTGEMIDANANSIGKSAVSDAIDAIDQEGEWIITGEGERWVVDQDRIDEVIRELQELDYEDDLYDAEGQIDDFTKRVMSEVGQTSNWDELIEQAGVTAEEAVSMSDAEILARATRPIVEKIVEELTGTDDIPELDNHLAQAVVIGHMGFGPPIHEDARGEMVMEIMNDMESGKTLTDSLYAAADQGLWEYHAQNPYDYNEQYIREEIFFDDDDAEFAERFGGQLAGDSQREFISYGEGEITDGNLYFMGRANNGEVVTVMKASEQRAPMTSAQAQDIADRFGVDISEIGDRFLYVDYLASKYPRHGYGTEQILQALQYAHENDMGISGSATMGAAMFYAKLGAQYLTEMGQTEGGTAFWSNTQVHEAYNWLQGELDRVKSGEIEIDELAKAEAEQLASQKGPESRRPMSTWESQMRQVTSSARDVLGSENNQRLARQLPDSIFMSGPGGEDLTLWYNENADEWMVGGHDEFSNLTQAQHTTDNLADMLDYLEEENIQTSHSNVAQTLASAVESIAQDTPSSGGGTEERGERVRSWVVPMINNRQLTGRPQLTSPPIQNAEYLTFEHDDIPDMAPVIAVETSEGRYSVVGDPSGEMINMTSSALTNMMYREGYGTPRAVVIDPSDSSAMARLVDHLSDASPRLTRPEVESTVDQWIAQMGEEDVEEEEMVAASGALRRKHYGPGPHSGTGTPQSVHGSGQISPSTSGVLPQGRVLSDSQREDLYGKRSRMAIETDVSSDEEIESALKDLSKEHGGAWVYSLRRFQRKITYIQFENPSSVPDHFHDLTMDTIGWKGKLRGFTDAAKERESHRGYTSRHYGPGDHPSGSPQTVHAGNGGGGGGGGGKKGGKATRVGITSARPGKPNRQVFEEMGKFEEQLKAIKTVKNAKVEPGLGGWEGGSEPTWIVSYEGNGQAMLLLARTAQEYNQDAVLLMKQGTDSVLTDFAFQRALKPSERRAVEEMAVDVGMGGWTWYREQGGHAVLRAVAVPQWGGDKDTHLQNAEKIQTMLRAAGMDPVFSSMPVSVDIMQREGENSYEEILAQAG